MGERHCIARLRLRTGSAKRNGPCRLSSWRMAHRRLQLAALVAGVLILYGAGLTYSPPYLHEAELLFGLHAHAIATTGHDVYGRLLPLYFQMKPIGENVWFHPAIV